MTEKPAPYKTPSFLCRKSSHLPRMIVEKDDVIILDDFAGRVELNKEQFENCILEYIAQTPDFKPCQP